MRRDVARNVSEIPSNNHGDVARYVSTNSKHWDHGWA